MQEQNFEKQVQHKLDELSLTPSAPVWQKVEKEIREKKKRRRLIVFWLFPFLIGAGTFWGIHTFMGKEENQVTRISTSNPQAAEKQISTSTSKEQMEVTVNAKQPTTTVPNQNISATTITEASSLSTPPTPAIKTSTTRKKPNQIKLSENQDNVSSLMAKTKKKFKPVSPQKQKRDGTLIPDEVSSGIAIDVAIQDLSTDDRVGEVTSNLVIDTITKQQPTLNSSTITKEEDAKPNTALDSVQNKKDQNKMAKWSWAAQASYGIASLQTDFLSKAFGTPQAFSDPLLNSGTPSSPSPPAAMHVPPRIENGPAFHASIIVKRNLNKRFAATAALQYSYLSVKNSVGQTVERDTMVFYAAANRMVLDQFYRPVQSGGQLQEYVNQYHFLELPVGIEWQLHKRLPLRLQTGLSLSYLINTNALVYDPNARIFYQNNDLFSKWQLQFFSGITYRVWQHKSLGVHMGPYFQFGLTNLEKENKNHHLLSTGLKAAFSF
jgi:hypothetical protein